MRVVGWVTVFCGSLLGRQQQTEDAGRQNCEDATDVPWSPLPEVTAQLLGHGQELGQEQERAREGAAGREHGCGDTTLLSGGLTARPHRSRFVESQPTLVGQGLS